jgi:hypothetical protein
MSNKQKRSVSTPVVKEVAVESAQPAVAARRFSSNTSTEFNPDYSHVKAGLKRIAVLASCFILVLIVLSFILK